MGKLTNRDLNKHFGHLEDHQYRHYNRSLGCFVENKEHFIKLMEKGNMVPFEVAEQLAEDHDKKNPRKEYVLTSSAREIINSIKLTADRKGNIKLGNRAIRALREVGLFPTDAQMENVDKITKEMMAKTNH